MDKNKYTHVIVEINKKNKTAKHRLQKITACKTSSIAATVFKTAVEGLPKYFEVLVLTKKESDNLGLKPLIICNRVTKKGLYLKGL